MEKYFIKKYDSHGKGGYNCTDGGGGCLGYLHSEETREKLSIAHRGRKRTEEHRRKIGEARKGRKMSEETKRKMSEASKGRVFSEETKRKLSEANKKPINQYTKDGVLICTYKSLGDVAKQNNWKRSNIGECARGKNKTAYGYIWRYTN